MTRLRYAVPAALVTLALGACGGDDPAPEPAAASGPASPAPTTSSTSPGTDASPGESAGTADRPTVPRPATEILDWRPVPGPVGDTVTRGGEWSLTVSRTSTSYSLEGPDSGGGTGTAPGTRVSDALMDEQWAVVVLQDKAEQRPSVARVTDLRSGRTFTLDGRSDVPTTNGGTWALGEGRLLHATVSGKGAYCLAAVDLAGRASTTEWCAPERHGFNGARITPAGASLLTFDDSQPSCRTLLGLTDGRSEPFPGVPDCKAWDGLLTDDGAVWSVIPNERRIENAHFYARSGEEYLDLGPGTAGSLVWCGDASYFVRDPQREGEPAALMRWSAADGLSIAYESPGGQAFLGEPRCGGEMLTLTALAEGGDEQVTAPVP